MLKNLFMIFFFGSISSLYAHDLPIVYDAKVSIETKNILEKSFNEVATLMPLKLKQGLPKNIIINVTSMSSNQVMPGEEICHPSVSQNDRFVYGLYNHLSNKLTLNSMTIDELNKGPSASTKISCQHGSLYQQAIATIIHELTHAFDANQNNPSRNIEFLSKAGFKQGLLKIKNKNINALRSPDRYELVNSAESFAVNMEYFTMDAEYACRKPSLFNYYKKLLEMDPYPNRSCSLNRTVMLSNAMGFVPVKIDLERIYRIDYLMAAPGKDLSSGFGHSMFRVVVCAPERVDLISKKTIPATPFGPRCLDDKLYHLVISYRANVEDATLNYIKGIFGGYPSTLFVLSFADVLDEYNKDELRDVISYPLNLSNSEKNDFIDKVIEEHWNYRGSYKFFTNNCAVESQSLLRSSLERSDLATTSSLTPNGVLEDLDQLQLTDLKSNNQEKFFAKTDQLLSAYTLAYQYTATNNPKMDAFLKAEKDQNSDLDLHAEISLLKEQLIHFSSFSVIEQQILRTFGAAFRKRAVELFINSNDPQIKEKITETTHDLKIDFKDMTKAGYGVPLVDEMISNDDLNSKMDKSKNVSLEFEKTAKELLADDFKTLDSISLNIKTFNDVTIKNRKLYREKLEGYIHQVIHNLTLEESSRGLLLDISNGKMDRMPELRELLDPKLVSKTEILDIKLLKFVQDELQKN